MVAFPVTALLSGEIFAGVSLTGRAAWALGDGSMSKAENRNACTRGCGEKSYKRCRKK